VINIYSTSGCLFDLCVLILIILDIIYTENEIDVSTYKISFLSIFAA